jgi:hypothetical protein
MDDDDPLEQLLDELLVAHDRLQDREAGEETPAASPRHFGRAAIVLSTIVLALSASAAAAILIETRESAPLAGALPHQLLGSRYSLIVTPDLRAGHAAWCIALLDIRTRSSVLPSPTTCVSPQGRPLITRGAIATLSPTTGAISAWLLYAIVTDHVASLRAPGGARILPISRAVLPSDWKAAVTVATAPASKPRRATVANLTPLSAQGKRLTTRTDKPISLATRAVDAAHPPANVCRIEAHGLPQSSLLSARALRDPPSKSLPVTSGLLSCYSLNLVSRGEHATAAILVDSHDVDRRPPNLPGTRRLRGGRGLWVGTTSLVTASSGTGTGTLLARRQGHAWLVLQTPAALQPAEALLNRLSAQP